MGVTTGISLAGILDAASLACDAVGRPIGSHVGTAGPRFVGGVGTD
jgi:hydroxymethylglutaryl-CoA lyase